MAPEIYLKSLFGLEGRTAIVIGGTGVLGGAFCDALAGAGAHTLVVGRNRDHGETCTDRIKHSGGSAEFFPPDATSKKDLEAIVRHLAKYKRTADVVVNGAGVNSATPFLEIEDDEWNRIIDSNFKSVRIGCQVFGKFMIDQKTRGSIINIASVSGGIPLSRVFTYSATKAAVISLTRNLAREWAPHAIRVNALSPGFFPAEQNRAVLTPERVNKVMKHTPMDRFGSPRELAGALLLLAAPNAGSFLTGENLIVDGGFSSMTI